MSETTTIKVSRETHQALLDMGRKGETFDAILRRLMYVREYVKQMSDDMLENAEMRFYEEAEG